MKILGNLPEDPKPFKWDGKKLEAAYNEKYGIDEPEETKPEPVGRPEGSAQDGAAMTFQEIADFFGISEPMARRIYRIAIDKLRKVCPEYGIDRDCVLYDNDFGMCQGALNDILRGLGSINY
jgi:hypothetical protein